MSKNISTFTGVAVIIISAVISFLSIFYFFGGMQVVTMNPDLEAMNSFSFIDKSELKKEHGEVIDLGEDLIEIEEEVREEGDDEGSE